MSVLFVDEHGACVRYSGGRIIVTDPEDKELASLRVQEIETVVICVHASVTSAALSALLHAGVDTVYVDHNGRYLGRTQPALAKNLNLRLAQYAAFGDENFRLEIARRIATGKVTNMRVVLLRQARYRKSETVSARANRILESLNALSLAENPQVVLGLEGTATREYFAALSETLSPPFVFDGRRRRPPPDPVNAMLGFSYALLAGVTGSAVYAAGLDPFLGFYHREAYGRESLVLDLMEEFRPIVADSVVLACCNKRIVDPTTDFEERDGGVYLNEKGRSKVFSAFHSRLKETVQPGEGLSAIPYSRIIHTQARRLARCVATGNPDYCPFTVR